MRIALATCARLPGLYGEEQALLPLFEKRGVEAQAVVWNDPAADWSAFDCVVIRSTWDYHKLFPEFRRWLAALAAAGIRTLNPLPLLEWNLDKFYLRELEQAGVRLIPTAFFEQGTSCELAALVAEKGWSRSIVKPTVSGGAHDTYLIGASQAPAYQLKTDAILRRCGLLVQPYFPEIEQEGEASLLFFGGQFAFAARKKPAPKDFRVQFEHGGTFQRFAPEPSLIKEAQQILKLLPHAPAYARVDGVCRADEFYLMEVELIEPYLYLAVAPEMSERYVDAISQAVLHLKS